MVKYVDAGFEDASPSSSSKKKKNKKGFKADRRANYERMLARKLTGKDTKKPADKRPTRVKSVVFDDAARRDYLLTLHKKKNERRVQAFVDTKKKMRKENARTRQQQREEARRAYNNYAKVPILPNYTFQIPSYVDAALDESDDEDEERSVTSSGHDSDDANTAEEGPAWVYMGDDAPAEEVARDEDEHAEEERHRAWLKEKLRQRKLATKAKSTHAMPASMVGGPDTGEADGEAGEGDPRRRHRIDDDSVTVEVKPLFGGRGALVPSGQKAASTLPSQNFSDLPSVVEQELRRLRQETKGPSRTKSKVHMMKELEKIRKIKKHSRKGHGKRKASGKRKNRRK